MPVCLAGLVCRTDLRIGIITGLERDPSSLRDIVCVVLLQIIPPRRRSPFNDYVCSSSSAASILIVFIRISSALFSGRPFRDHWLWSDKFIIHCAAYVRVESGILLHIVLCKVDRDKFSSAWGKQHVHRRWGGLSYTNCHLTIRKKSVKRKCRVSGETHFKEKTDQENWTCIVVIDQQKAINSSSDVAFYSHRVSSVAGHPECVMWVTFSSLDFNDFAIKWVLMSRPGIHGAEERGRVEQLLSLIYDIK